MAATLYGIFGDAQWTNKERLSDVLLRDLVEHFSRISLGNQAGQSDILGQSYEYLIKKFADATNKKAGEFYTPRPIVRLMVNILDPHEGESIYDPACGTGGMLLEAIHHVRERHGDDRTLWGKLFGQEKNLTTSAIAKMNLFLHGAADFKVFRGDTLRNPLFFLGDNLATFDCVIANPPFSLEKWGSEVWTSDPFGRNCAGMPPDSTGDYAWVQHMVKSMAPKTGRMAVVLPHGALFRMGAEGRIRQNLLGMDLLEAVIGLGPNLFYGTSLAACILVLRQRKVKERRKKVLIIDASREFRTGRAQNELLPQHVERIYGWYHDYKDVEGVARVVTLDDIAANDHNLNIPRYVEVPVVEHAMNVDDPSDPLQFVIVTSKLLTGFDAPILQVMYLDKPMKDHNLLQAICRTNRTFGQEKTHGLIVDYIGIFDDVARALDFDEKAVQQVVSNIDELRKALPVQVQTCLAFFVGVDRTVGGYEGLLAAQQCLPTNDVRDKFAAAYSVLGTIWEALSPDPCLTPYETDYRWLTQVYESVKPPSGNGRLLWHALGAKTVELINENVHVESVRDDLDTLVLDADVLDGILAGADHEKKGKEVEIKLIARLRKHAGNPKFTALGERLEKVKERHEQGFLTSLEFLKQMLELAREVVEAEKQTDPVEERDRAKEALTELFNEAKGSNTHIIVERIVNDIDEIVRKVRFPDWQSTSQGERLVQKELRKTLLKYQLHRDQDLFDRAFAYIQQYY